MQTLLAAILDIDILSPPREYVTSILQAICEYLGYRCGVAVEYVSDRVGEVFAVHHLPDDLLALLEQDNRNSQDDPTASLLDAHGTITVLRPMAEATETPWGHLCRRHGLQAIVRVPMMSKGQVLGYYMLYDPVIREVAESELELLGQVAEMAAVAVASNRYLEQLNLKTRELQDEITERRRAEEALRTALQERNALEEIIDRSPVVVMLWNARDWSVEFVSRSITKFGYAPEELCAGAVPTISLIHPSDVDWVMQEAINFVKAGAPDELMLEFRAITSTGNLRWIEGRMWGRRDAVTGRITHVQGVLHDISERKRAEATIRHQAFHDHLTDLPNRLLFNDRLVMALAHAKRCEQMLAVMFLDLDRFKTINDTLGHAVGDHLLQEVAERLTSRLRQEDTVARLGGDEFTVLLPEISHPDAAGNVARKIFEALQRAFVIDGHELHITTSIGISCFPRDGEDAQTLLRNADTALYHAKDGGRNTFEYYTPSMSAKAKERLALETSLRHALERQEFILYYQPQVSIASGQMIGMESLIRWQHPELGLVSPGSFIPLADETGLIEPIGQWALHEACEQNRRWQDAGHPPLRVSVNLSARQFYQENLVEMVDEVLRDTRLSPRYLELEITETVAMRNVDYSVMVMRALKSMGVHLSMDDFGIGYSSLIYLKKFPINTLKIDQSFVRGLTSDPNDKAIATAIIAMARSLHLHVIAEGVEMEEQLAFLREHQCDSMQGYLFSRPLPADGFGQLLRFLSI